MRSQTFQTLAKKETGPKIQNGLVVAIEPMINLGRKEVEQDSDGWTVITKDRQPSAHFEHNIAVIDGEPEILSTFDFLSQKLNLTYRLYTLLN